MQIKGAYGGAYFKNIEQKDSKKAENSEKSLKSGNVLKTEKNSEVNVTNRVEIQKNMYTEQLKSKQTEISNFQSMAADIQNLEENFENARNLSSQSENTEKLGQVFENIKNIVSNSLIDSSTLNSVIKSSNSEEISKEDVVNGVLKDIVGIKNNLNIKLESLNEDITKINIANENSRAATSDFDVSKLKNMLKDISNQSGEALSIQAGRISQNRVFEVLQNE